MMSGPQSFGFVSGQKDFTTNKTTGGAFLTPPVLFQPFMGKLIFYLYGTITL